MLIQITLSVVTQSSIYILIIFVSYVYCKQRSSDITRRQQLLLSAGYVTTSLFTIHIGNKNYCPFISPRSRKGKVVKISRKFFV